VAIVQFTFLHCRSFIILVTARHKELADWKRCLCGCVSTYQFICIEGSGNLHWKAKRRYVQNWQKCCWEVKKKGLPLELFRCLTWHISAGKWVWDMEKSHSGIKLVLNMSFQCMLLEWCHIALSVGHSLSCGSLKNTRFVKMR
jgi:hypothetical protein